MNPRILIVDDHRSAPADADVSDIYAVSLAARVAGASGVVACNLVERGHTRHSLANLPGRLRVDRSISQQTLAERNAT